ncbi:MAG: hypothetical protein NXI15_06130 [Gammaproteobacteria bacterium]|nr:hypothetical protein [Gammaproteobacteria bacterium]
MYRYKVDQAVTYTPNDFLLFRESPFALWMERLTLENPDHGILPDAGTEAPVDDALPQDDMVETLREEGRDVVLIPWQQSEARRRADTLDAMRSGADFIVNGMLALGPLSGNVNLLMRTSGYSDFGDFLYIPCDTQAKDTFNAAFRLCFMADLLHSLQGQLPPQMLLVRGDADVIPLQTEDHIHYYRAVKQRFMNAMREFRKHRMPDPSLSAHFGRWADCASEVLRQRAMSSDAQHDERLQDDDEHLPQEQAEQYLPMAQAAGAASAAGASGVVSASLGAEHRVMADTAAPAAASSRASVATRSLQLAARAPEGVSTLAEQASLVTPDTFKTSAAPGQTPNLARFPRLVPDPPPRAKPDAEAEVGAASAASTDAAAKDPEAAAKRAWADAKPADSDAAHTPERRIPPTQIPDSTGTLRDVTRAQDGTEAGGTLAEIAQAAQPQRSAPPPQHGLTELEDPLQDLAFIGSATGGRATAGPFYDAPVPASSTAPVPLDTSSVVEESALERSAAELPPAASDIDVAERGPGQQSPNPPLDELPRFEVDQAPAPTLRESIPEPKIEGYEVELLDPESLELEPREPHLLPPQDRSAGRAEPVRTVPPVQRKPLAHPGGSAVNGNKPTANGVDYDDALVDLDSAPPPTLMPVNARLLSDELEPSGEAIMHDLRKRDDQAPLRGPSQFSSSLITSEEFDD